MEDARRFLRYVMPGLVFGTETLLWLFVVLPEWTQTLVSNLGDKSGLGVVLGGVLASGAIGYIFSTIHHLCHWRLCWDRGILDHSDLINDAIEKRLISSGDRTVDGTGDKEGWLVCPQKVIEAREEALAISIAHWYRPRSAINEETYRKLDSLGDQAHGLGTARIASFFSGVVALLFIFKLGTFCVTGESILRFVGMVVLWLGITGLFHWSYRRVGIIAQAIYDRVFKDAHSNKQRA